MSFAATLGLVALVQIGMPRLLASPDNSATAWRRRPFMALLGKVLPLQITGENGGAVQLNISKDDAGVL
jgi:hypothetical protein